VAQAIRRRRLPDSPSRRPLIRIRHGHHCAALAALLKLTGAERAAAIEEQTRRWV